MGFGMQLAEGTRMTAPRQVLRGTTYLVTRRCSERRLFLRPSGRVNEVFLYALALYAQRYRILVHAFCVLSNHYHLVLTDPWGTLPDFMRDLHALVARATNCSLGRWERFWDPASYSAVRLENDAAVTEKMLYVLANPVAAGLVRHGREWPGLWSDPRRIGRRPIRARRPKGFFNEKGDMPAVVELQLTPPPGFEADPLIEQLMASLHDAENATADRLAAEGRSFLGLAGILSQSPHGRPATGEPRRQLSPRVACREKWKRIEALQRLKEFARAYREALAAWRNGRRDVLFPTGTWLMRVQHSACCAGSG